MTKIMDILDKVGELTDQGQIVGLKFETGFTTEEDKAIWIGKNSIGLTREDYRSIGYIPVSSRAEAFEIIQRSWRAEQKLIEPLIRLGL